MQALFMFGTQTLVFVAKLLQDDRLNKSHQKGGISELDGGRPRTINMQLSGSGSTNLSKSADRAEAFRPSHMIDTKSHLLDCHEFSNFMLYKCTIRYCLCKTIEMIKFKSLLLMQHNQELTGQLATIHHVYVQRHQLIPIYHAK